MATPAQLDMTLLDCDSWRGSLSANVALPWYAAYISPRHEKRVATHMECRAVDCFLPLYRSIRRWRDRRKEISLPLFPGYVFFRVTAQNRLKVLTIPGVLHIVSFNGKPAALPEREIAALRDRLLGNARLEPHPYLTVGRRVLVRSGPMAGLEGILVRRKDRMRVVLSIDLIMRSVAVEVDEADIAAAA